MHGHVKGTVARFRPAVVRRVYEVGSRNTNGSLRQFFTDAEQYHGIDIRRGHGVDEKGLGRGRNGGRPRGVRGLGSEGVVVRHFSSRSSSATRC